MLSKPLLTIHEVSDLLKMKESTVRNWIRDGELRAIKMGRDWRVAVKDLEAYLNAHANRPET
ncbi:helix-turn-helix domain-containing protein [Nisaea acidiphila]|uniref:Helix-turn-helix domain-containing protein n=1 Tax=Nisaea acidiphila TaxID=1862145 RepID=A0A9J7AVU9_9PROT|nr:helix-turn-helix domain-containing protein [Nisaea acidiphila]UUX50585.1 helix-turn-helix domain-containing protein [Nisaea acidiphila]